MKNIFLLTALCLSSLFLAAQQPESDILKLDLDNDRVPDIVIFDKENAVITCKLSSQKFKAVSSKGMEFDPSSAGIRKTKSGFEYHNNWMRSGYACQFRYNPTAKQIQLIGMSRYEFGPASNDGSGESSVNLLTNNYIGNWNYFDEEKVKLIPIPPIKRKMILPVVYLAKYSDDTFFKFQDLCTRLYENRKAEMLKKK